MKTRGEIYKVTGVPGINDFRIIVLRKLPGDKYAYFRIVGNNATEAVKGYKKVWPWMDEIRNACLLVNNKQYNKAMEKLEKMNQRRAIWLCSIQGKNQENTYAIASPFANMCFYGTKNRDMRWESDIAICHKHALPTNPDMFEVNDENKTFLFVYLIAKEFRAI